MSESPTFVAIATVVVALGVVLIFVALFNNGLPWFKRQHSVTEIHRGFLRSIQPDWREDQKNIFGATKPRRVSVITFSNRTQPFIVDGIVRPIYEVEVRLVRLDNGKYRIEEV